jgi:hypothetical protein
MTKNGGGSFPRETGVESQRDSWRIHYNAENNSAVEELVCLWVKGVTLFVNTVILLLIKVSISIIESFIGKKNEYGGMRQKTNSAVPNSRK